MITNIISKKYIIFYNLGIQAVFQAVNTSYVCNVCEKYLLLIQKKITYCVRTLTIYYYLCHEISILTDELKNTV